MLPLALTLWSISAAPADAAPRPFSIAAPSINAVNVPKEEGAFYLEHFALSLRKGGLRVVTAREIETLLGFERQKQLLGCSDDASNCMAELGNALGVEGLLFLDVAKISGQLQLNAKVIGAVSGEQIAAQQTRLDADGDVLAALDGLAAALSKKLVRGGTPSAALTPTVEETREEEGSLRKSAWIPAAVGGVLLAGGAAGFAVSNGKHAALDDPERTFAPGEGEALAEDGKRFQLFGQIGVGLGAAALGTAAAMYLFGGDAPVQPQASFGPSGATFGLSGVLP